MGYPTTKLIIKMDTTTRTDVYVVTGVFRDRDHAERAYEAAKDLGYDRDDVTLMMSKDSREKYFNADEADSELADGNKALEGTGVGSAVGGTVGAVLGAIAAIGTSVALPGLGLLVAGPLAGALAGAGAGGLTGGLVGALVGAGIPEEHAETYERRIKEGALVLAVDTRTREEARKLEQAWVRIEGGHIHADAKDA